jgi:hypothetical protein
MVRILREKWLVEQRRMDRRQRKFVGQRRKFWRVFGRRRIFWRRGSEWQLVNLELKINYDRVE